MRKGIEKRMKNIWKKKLKRY